MKISRVISGMFWRFIEKSASQGISLAVTILLARLLSPTDFGTLALLTIFINILQVFVDSGLGSALIQKKDVDDVDFSTVFYFNCVSCAVMYGVLYFGAPWIAEFYQDEALTELIRVLGLVLLISGVRSVQNAYIIRKLAFRLSFTASLTALMISAIVAVVMAFYGFGVWALIMQQIVNVAVGTVVLWYVTAWRPKLTFSRQRFHFLFTFGSRLLLSSLLDTGYKNLSQLIIGRIYSPSDLAYYTQGARYPMTIVSNINASIDSVLFPVLSQAQDDTAHLRNMMRRAVCVSSFLLWPLMMLLAAAAEPLVRLLMTEKWLPLVPYLQVFCFSYALWPIHTANLNGIKALGRSDIFLRLEIIKKVMGLCVLVTTMFYGPFVMACGTAASGLVSTAINSWPNRKLLGYSCREQWEDIAPGCILAVLVGATVYPLGHMGWPDALSVAAEVLLGLLLYALLAYLLKLEVLTYLVQTVESIRKKHQSK
ncbi:Membrane protein involved in the export of O-antigen and teichoic acid [Selenomonas ruminantium]|uniref:Membrane protein involved in the export of O-antigen and teichoic acid n=1 Tax=Selenomonas ruminantium TaxID=971 RepID=A0A1I3EH46_SELRU|nr:lipopolysaccharide biosynthesis protein [Selenomonas ruminantium]SFH98299.1 Membrane protein involved in the export of O-antigen and teichoic acid [Selenomonas ruminantium]